MNPRGIAGKLRFFIGCIGLFGATGLSLGLEFSEPAPFSDAGSNLGEQQIVEVVRRWVGPTPHELAPDVVPLGSMKGRKYIFDDPSEVGGELIKVNKELDLQTYDLEFPDSRMRKPSPRRIEGWVGPLPDELAPGAIALGSLANRRFVALPGEGMGNASAEGGGNNRSEDLFNLSLFTSARPYFTDNVLRQKSEHRKSVVVENALGLSLATRGMNLGQYLVLVPRIDFMTQVASYENNEVKDSLGYAFGMLKGGLAMELPANFSISMGMEYNLLHGTDSGDKMFDARAPSLRIGKIFTPGERTMIMADASVKYAWTHRVIDVDMPGVFADDGDNFQAGVSLALVQLLDAEGKFMLMPRVGLTRTEYLKNEQDGRVDWLLNAGAGLTWQALEWLSFDLSAGWSTLWMNRKGKDLQGESSSFKAIDAGLTLMASHAF